MAFEALQSATHVKAKVRIVHGLLRSYSQNVHLYTASLGAALRELGVIVDIQSGFFLPSRDALGADLTVFSYDLMSARNAARWPAVQDSIRAWSRLSPRRIALVQDDFSLPRLVEALVLEGTIDRIFSPHAFDGRAKVLYPLLAESQTKFVRNGYLDPDILRTFDQSRPKKESFSHQKVLGRARRLGSNFGFLGSEKSRALEAVGLELECRGIPTDISSSNEERVYGFDWYVKIATARAVINPVGGSSVIDKSGWVPRVRPDSPLFPGVLRFVEFLNSRSNTQGFALPNFGPRVLEALALGTPQVLTHSPELIETLFPGLKAWQHFLPLEKDLSNLSEISDYLSDERALGEIAEAGRAYAEGEESFYFTSFAEKVMSELSESGNFKPDARLDEAISQTQSTPHWPVEDLRELHLQVYRDLRRVTGRSPDSQLKTLKSIRETAVSSVQVRSCDIVELFLKGEVTPFAIQAIQVLQNSEALRGLDTVQLMRIFSSNFGD